MTHAPSPTNRTRPLAVTMGEPAGIGPELIGRLWSARDKQDLPDILYVGSVEALRQACPSIDVQVVAKPSDSASLPAGTLPALDIPLAEPNVPGQLNPANGAAVVSAIDTAVKLALENAVSGVITAPIHKAALYKAGFTAPGHTEYLARLCGLPDNASVMMLAAKELRVVPVTIHIALKDVAKQLTTDQIVHAGMATSHDLKTKFGIENPRIAIAALNPHAGEDGAMGLEEATHITPAVWALKDHGVNVEGPLPADTLFHEEARAQFDTVLCMYHDQALIPVKMLDFWGGVNITLGLPIIRTSPDHGTALPLAGTGQARTDSMLAALRMAADMADRANAGAEV